MWDSIVEGVSPHLVAGSIMVAVMGVMFVAHKMYSSKHKPQPQDPLEVLKLRFARGEISREEYEERRKVLAG
jgi:putative membrane protein